MKIVVFFSFCLFHFRFYYFLYFFFCTWDCCETRAKTLTKSMKHLRDVCAGVCKMMTSLNLMTLDWSCSILKHTHSPAWYYSYFSTFFLSTSGVVRVLGVCVFLQARARWKWRESGHSGEEMIRWRHRQSSNGWILWIALCRALEFAL